MKEEAIKTVGVITMHKVINYGSFLQAYATQYVIEKLGHKCEIIDYDFPNEWHFKRGVNGSVGLKKHISNMIHSFGIKPGHRKKIKINKAVNQYLNLSRRYRTPSEIKSNPPIYDVYLTGSDQTWNPKHTKGDDTFLLNFAPKNTRKISFSASLAGNNLKDEYKSSFEELLRQYDSISIRDAGGNAIMKELVGKEVSVTLDPTLMMNREEWSIFAKNSKLNFPEEGYIIFYLITHSFDVTPYIYELLKKLQESTNLKVYSFSEIPSSFGIDYETCLDIGAEDFIKLFENSSYVVTSSFHGTAYAVNFGIPLYSVIDSLDTVDDRQTSLLRKLGIDHCLVPLNKSFIDIEPSYDIDTEQQSLDALRKESLTYLRSSLSDECE
ncbi:polysaccharide pyruvyl transferase family protein [Vibrio alginolyticus]|uniref:polysaccharide pyruvyl transferase family protein n=1 Tax=Vibrio alginolyticus TaxID=663 RepID=UPI001BD2CC39|nr:polysaccharide pyruvyl transferase family protein [Vibrio alginolyticus]MBT0015935.1 polysaccharide pyruvyl transferase family protein [Vibrio alginolyticus]